MKICPVCSTTYTDETMRFCTKDGNTLAAFNEEPPTVVSTPPPAFDATLSDFSPPQNDTPQFQKDGQFVVSTAEPQPIPPPAAAPNLPAPKTPKKKSNAALFVILGILGLFGLLGIAGIVGAYFYLYSGKQVAVANTNSDSNTNAANDNSVDIVSNPTLDINANSNENANGNLNLNANAKPSPSPKPSPSISPSPANRNANQNENRNNNRNDNGETPEPTPTPPPTPTPKPSPTQQTVKTVGGGVVNGKATSLPKPPYPPAARAVRAGGQVNVQVLIDENGNVVSASAVSGHPLLRQAAASAARQAKFSPTMLSGQPVKVSGVIVYNFVLN